MADDRLQPLTTLKALQQLRLARERTELGGSVARTAQAEAHLRAEDALLEDDEARQMGLLAADHFDPGELRLAGLVLEQQQQAALLARGTVDAREREEQEARQLVAICEAQTDNVEEAFRKARRKSAEKADSLIAVEFAAPGARQNGRKA